MHDEVFVVPGVGLITAFFFAATLGAFGGYFNYCDGFAK